MAMPRASRRVAIALAVLWLAPTALLIRRNSVWASIATVGFVVSVAACWRRPSHSAIAPTTPVDPGILSPPPEPPSRLPLLHLACAGALINLTLLAAGTQRQVAAGLFIALATAIIMARSSPEQRDRAIARHRRLSVPLALVLALLGLLRWGAGRWMTDTEEEYWARVEAASAERRRDDLAFRGVILFVDKTEQKVVPPSPVTLKSGFFDPSREPVVIPFSGVYWFLRAPDRLPPATSLIRHGSPDELFFRSADRRPLTMEAHQHLGRQVSLDCCSGLDVELASVDRFPGTIHVEVTLANTANGALPVQSLGTQPMGVETKREETLRFPIARDGLSSFDEITVRFRLARVRNTSSARIAIRQFTLKPRRGA